jgi:hypothetical protein
MDFSNMEYEEHASSRLDSLRSRSFNHHMEAAGQVRQTVLKGEGIE